MTSEYYNERTGKLRWDWLLKAPIGFKVQLREGRAASRNAAAYYGRKITTRSLPNGDYEIEVIK